MYYLVITIPPIPPPPSPPKKIKLHEIEADKICAQQKNTLNPSQDAEAIRQGNTC